MFDRGGKNVQNMKRRNTPPEFDTPTFQSPNPYPDTTIIPTQRTQEQENMNEIIQLYQYYLSKEKDGSGFVSPTYLTSVQELVKHEERFKAVEIIYWYHRITSHQFDKTFILAIRILDRFLTKVKVMTSREFYKLTVTCIYLASKYEECYLNYGIKGLLDELHHTLRLEFFKYEKKDFFEAEVKILKVLEYRLAIPTIHEFVSLMSQNASPELRKIIRYITLYSSYEYSLLRFDLSVLSCAIVYLSELIYNDWGWEYFDQSNMSERVWKKNPIEVKKCSRILWNLMGKCRFTTLRMIMSNVKCRTASKMNRILSVTELVDLWGKKILFFESQKKQTSGSNNNINNNNGGFVTTPAPTTTTTTNNSNNTQPLMFVNYGYGGMVINNYGNNHNGSSNNDINNNSNGDKDNGSSRYVINNNFNQQSGYYLPGRK